MEYERKKAWEKTGYVVLRTAGSHGPFDLVAIRDGGHINLIQCKSVERDSEAIRLIDTFRAKPPLTPSRFYHQCLEVKVKGGRIEQAFV